jgi:hypothetical protein
LNVLLTIKCNLIAKNCEAFTAYPANLPGHSNIHPAEVRDQPDQPDYKAVPVKLAPG